MTDDKIIPRLLNLDIHNWKSIQDILFKKLGGLNFLLRCTYDTKYLDPKLPVFYKDILSFCAEINCKYEQGQETIPFNNKAILIGGNSFPKEVFVLKTYLMKMDNLFLFQIFKRNMT